MLGSWCAQRHKLGINLQEQFKKNLLHAFFSTATTRSADDERRLSRHTETHDHGIPRRHWHLSSVTKRSNPNAWIKAAHVYSLGTLIPSFLSDEPGSRAPHHLLHNPRILSNDSTAEHSALSAREQCLKLGHHAFSLNHASSFSVRSTA